MELAKTCLIISLFFKSSFQNDDFNPSTSKYLTYCPCMGRFGNQAEQMLGAISLAKGTNRSLLVPPFSLNERKPEDNDFSSMFDLKVIQQLLPGSMDLSTFMTKYSEKYWKKKQIFCYRVAMARSEDNNTCPYQYGEPFTGFWKQFGIEFDESIGIDDGGYISFKPQYHSQWKRRFNDVKVLAFFGNPGSFPSLESEQEFIKYIQFNEEMREKVRNFIWTRMGQRKNSRSSDYRETI